MYELRAGAGTEIPVLPGLRRCGSPGYGQDPGRRKGRSDLRCAGRNHGNDLRCASIRKSRLKIPLKEDTCDDGVLFSSSPVFQKWFQWICSSILTSSCLTGTASLRGRPIPIKQGIMKESGKPRASLAMDSSLPRGIRTLHP